MTVDPIGHPDFGTRGRFHQPPVLARFRQRRSIGLHVFDMPKDSLELTGLKSKVASVKALDGGAAVRFTQSGEKLQIAVNGIKANPHATVLAITTR